MKKCHMFAVALLAALCCSSAAIAQTALATVPVGGTAMAVAFNAVTNKIYVAAQTGTSLTEIDGLTFQGTTIPLQTPTTVATDQIEVNPITNTIYVINVANNNVAVVNGANSRRFVLADPCGSLCHGHQPHHEQIIRRGF